MHPNAADCRQTDGRAPIFIAVANEDKRKNGNVLFMSLHPRGQTFLYMCFWRQGNANKAGKEPFKGQLYGHRLWLLWLDVSWVGGTDFFLSKAWVVSSRGDNKANKGVESEPPVIVKMLGVAELNNFFQKKSACSVQGEFLLDFMCGAISQFPAASASFCESDATSLLWCKLQIMDFSSFFLSLFLWQSRIALCQNGAIKSEPAQLLGPLWCVRPNGE